METPKIYVFGLKDNLCIILEVFSLFHILAQHKTDFSKALSKDFFFRKSTCMHDYCKAYNKIESDAKKREKCFATV